MEETDVSHGSYSSEKKKDSLTVTEGSQCIVYAEDVPRHLLCAICNSPLQNAVQVSCGERWDRHCYKLQLQNLSSEQPLICPNCGETIDQKQTFPDVFAEKECSKLLVHCWENSSGCDFVGPKHSLQAHWDNCDYVKLPCARAECNEQVMRLNMDQHLNHQCQWRTIICRCGEEMKAFQQTDHESSCSEVLVECPNRCQEGRFIKRKDMEQHCKDCPRQMFKCKFVGCKHELDTQQALAEHVEMHLLEHVSGVSQECLALRETVDVAMADMGKSTLFLQNIEETGRAIDAEWNHVKEIEQRRSEMETQVKLINEKTTEATRQSVANLRHDFDVRLSDINKYFEHLSERLEKMEHITTSNTRKLQSQEERLSASRTRSGDRSGMSPAETQQFSAQDRVLAVHDVKLAEHSLRLDMMDCKGVNGVLLWKIMDVRRRRRDAVSGKTPSIYSQPFYTSPCGYKMCGRLYLNGDGIGKNTHLSLFFVIMRGEYDSLLMWPFSQKVTLSLVDQDGRRHISDTFRPDPTSSSFHRPTREMNVASGCPLFAPVEKLDAGNYVKDDTVFIRMVIDTSGAVAPDERR